MREIVARLAPTLREAGFRGSGRTFRKLVGEFVFVLQFQSSRHADEFYVNLGAHPCFIPAEGHADVRRVDPSQCLLWTRVGRSWPRPSTPRREQELLAMLATDGKRFFDEAKGLREAIVTDPVGDVLRRYSGQARTEARTALHLGRAALALGALDNAERFLEIGFELCGHATGLRLEIEDARRAIAARRGEAVPRAVVYVAMLDEGTPVWRPVAAEQVGVCAYRLLDPTPEDESWEFASGSTVLCCPRPSSDGETTMTAVRGGEDLRRTRR